MTGLLAYLAIGAIYSVLMASYNKRDWESRCPAPIDKAAYFILVTILYPLSIACGIIRLIKESRP